MKRWLAYGLPCGVCGYPVHSWALGMPTSPLDCRCTRLTRHWETVKEVIEMTIGPKKDGEIIGDLGDDWVTTQGG